MVRRPLHTALGLPAILVIATGCPSVPGACEANSFTDQKCDNPDSSIPDTGPFVGFDPTFSSIDVAWDGEAWIYGVELGGWAGLVTIDMRAVEGTSEWAETHPLDDVDFAKDGTWDRWYKRIFVVTTVDQQRDGVSTMFPATEAQAGLMTWMATSWDRALTTAIDCRVWGQDILLFAEYGCVEWRGE